MSEFARLFEESLSDIPLYPGAIIKGTVVDIDKDYVTVNAGLKSESFIPKEQFINEQGELEVAVGDEVDVALDAVEDGFGETKLSREKAKRAEAWAMLEKAHSENSTIVGFITGKVKGGLTVDINTIRAFLPGSLVDVRPVRDTGYLEGKELELKVIKIDAKRNNVVVSRRAVVESESNAEREELLNNLQEGHEVKGIVKNLTDYGAFVDLGGVDGLLHITDMAWKRVKHPSEVVVIGQEILVKVLKLDREKTRVSLGLKQLGNDPWKNIVSRYPEGARLSGQVTNITDYGCFVEIEEGIEGLVHVSEMDWTNKNIHPSKVVQLGDVVNVMVLDIDEERRRISLGIKQCVENPWVAFAGAHAKGDKIKGKIKSITDFGVFVGLSGSIDGLVHLSDVSWDEDSEKAVRNYKKGDEIETVILAIDAERERISLGIKQLESSSFGDYIAEHTKGTTVKGKVIEVDTKGIFIELAPEVNGYLDAGEVERARIDDMRKRFTEGDEVEAKIIGVDRKDRVINLSIKAKAAADEAEALRNYSDNQQDAPQGTTLGDLLKEHIDDKDAE